MNDSLVSYNMAISQLIPKTISWGKRNQSNQSSFMKMPSQTEPGGTLGTGGAPVNQTRPWLLKPPSVNGEMSDN